MKIRVFESRMGLGMEMSSTAMLCTRVTRSRNRRVIFDYNPCKKHKHFDEKEFLRERERLEGI